MPSGQSDKPEFQRAERSAVPASEPESGGASMYTSAGQNAAVLVAARRERPDPLQADSTPKRKRSRWSDEPPAVSVPPPPPAPTSSFPAAVPPGYPPLGDVQTAPQQTTMDAAAIAAAQVAALNAQLQQQQAAEQAAATVPTSRPRPTFYVKGFRY